MNLQKLDKYIKKGKNTFFIRHNYETNNINVLNYFISSTVDKYVFEKYENLKNRYKASFEKKFRWVRNKNMRGVEPIEKATGMYYLLHHKPNSDKCRLITGDMKLTYCEDKINDFFIIGSFEWWRESLFYVGRMGVRLTYDEILLIFEKIKGEFLVRKLNKFIIIENKRFVDYIKTTCIEECNLLYESLVYDVSVNYQMDNFIFTGVLKDGYIKTQLISRLINLFDRNEKYFYRKTVR